MGEEPSMTETSRRSASSASAAQDSLVFQPGPGPRQLLKADGQLVEVPADWELLPPGDAAVTRRVKAAGPFWLVQQRRGRRVFSQGIWAPATTIQAVQASLEQERATPEHAKKQAAQAQRRERDHAKYVIEFEQAVVEFLAFHPRYDALAKTLATAITQHATPVGSGTVARTQRLTVPEKARAAVIAWMRHQTTGYDEMKIARVKGRRREVRRELAQQSVRLLQNYRQGQPAPPNCPLMAAVSKIVA